MISDTREIRCQDHELPATIIWSTTVTWHTTTTPYVHCSRRLGRHTDRRRLRSKWARATCWSVAGMAKRSFESRPRCSRRWWTCGWEGRSSPNWNRTTSGLVTSWTEEVLRHRNAWPAKKDAAYKHQFFSNHTFPVRLFLAQMRAAAWRSTGTTHRQEGMCASSSTRSSSVDEFSHCLQIDSNLRTS